MGKPLSDSQLSAIKKDTLEGLIDRELLYQESQKKGIKIDDAAVKEEMETLKKRFPSEAEFKNMMSVMNLTEAALKYQLISRRLWNGEFGICRQRIGSRSYGL